MSIARLKPSKAMENFGTSLTRTAEYLIVKAQDELLELQPTDDTIDTIWDEDSTVQHPTYGYCLWISREASRTCTLPSKVIKQTDGTSLIVLSGCIAYLPTEIA